MALRTRAELDAFFETGDKPTEQQFADLIESSINIPDDGIRGWQKFTIDFTDFQPNATAFGNIQIIAPPALSILTSLQLKHSTAWTGGAITLSVLSVRDPSQLFQYSSVHTVFTAPTDTDGTSGRNELDVILDAANPGSINLILAVANGVIDDLTQGVVDVWLLIDQLP